MLRRVSQTIEELQIRKELRKNSFRNIKVTNLNKISNSDNFLTN